ncbi:MAG: TlpA family protein disulfide reductase [SAR324 cluster bacterium]|nr:TlpA family protein disulfide reductase [SAR324 cluster bacterium]MCH8888055.1 TlpA family protein disulfide reductase [SAR324 cluster bacterium]
MLEAPALARIEQEYRSDGLKVIAVNVFPQIPLQKWERYFRQFSGDSGIILAQDTRREAIITLNVRTAGATVILDKQGRIVFRDPLASTYKVLKDAVEKAL